MSFILMAVGGCWFGVSMFLLVYVLIEAGRPDSSFKTMAMRAWACWIYMGLAYVASTMSPAQLDDRERREDRQSAEIGQLRQDVARLQRTTALHRTDADSATSACVQAFTEWHESPDRDDQGLEQVRDVCNWQARMTDDLLDNLATRLSLDASVH